MQIQRPVIPKLGCGWHTGPAGGGAELRQEQAEHRPPAYALRPLEASVPGMSSSCCSSRVFCAFTHCPLVLTPQSAPNLS